VFRPLDRLPDVIHVDSSKNLFSPSDPRGPFLELWRSRWNEALGLPPAAFVQDNVSFSTAHTLRGLHLQTGEHAQGKLVAALSGAIWDVAVDVRRGSPTYGVWDAALLSAENRCMLYVPPGFVHGFHVLEAPATVLYRCTREYHHASELGVLWSDPALGIDWRLGSAGPVVSAKDQENLPLADPRVQRALPSA
jgi:dTDP-4-dehydrorhamnose 3,5-epimerase